MPHQFSRETENDDCVVKNIHLYVCIIMRGSNLVSIPVRRIAYQHKEGTRIRFVAVMLASYYLK